MILPFLLPALFLSACGYQMAGRGDLPEGVSTVRVHLLANRSGETGLETVITNAVVGELNRIRPGIVVEGAGADAVVSGTISGLNTRTIVHRTIQNAIERRVILTVTVNLTAAEGRTIWKGRQVMAEENYLVPDTGKIDAEINRREAIAVAAQRVAESIARRLLEDF